MKIVIDARGIRTSTGRYVERLVYYLQQVDKGTHEYIVLLEPGDYDWWQPKSKHFTKIVCPYTDFSLGEQLGLLRQLNNLHPDLVHFRMAQQPVLYKGTVVTTMQDLTTIRFRNPSKQWLVYSVKQEIYKWLNKRVAKKSAHIITPTEFVKQDVAQFTHIPLEKITVTLEAADPLPSPTPPPLQNLQKDNFIMYVGRPFPHKNLWRLIEAYGELQKTRPSLQLVLAGKKDPLYAAIEERVHAEGRSGIIFAGFVSDAEMHWLYQHCRAYIVPSLSEGFGLPGLEAMLHGAPVVSSNATCSPEVYGPGAHYFDPFSVSDMAKSIGNVIDNQKLRERLIEAGKKQAAKYSWERMARQTLAVYNKVLTNKDKPGAS